MPTENDLLQTTYKGRLQLLNDKALELMHAIDVMREAEPKSVNWGHVGQLGDAIKELDKCLYLVDNADAWKMREGRQWKTGNI